MTLSIQLLGQPRISRDGQTIHLPGYRPLALLAYLTVTGKAHPRDHLADLLFDESDDPRASLRWTLHKLRKAIGEDAILVGKHKISFNFHSDYWLDVSAFEAGENELYQGEFLEGLSLRDAYHFEEWLLIEREYLRGKYQAGLEKQLDGFQRQGEISAVVATAQQLVKLDNFREDWHYALMEAYARLGKREAALAQYEHLRRVLKDELDLKPSPETKELAEAIRKGEIGPGISPVESGRTWPGPTVSVDAPAASPVEVQDVVAGSVFRQRLHVDIRVIGFALVLILGFSGVLSVMSMNRRTAGNNGDLVGQGKSISQELAGRTVTVGGVLTVDVDNFMASMAPLEERTGIEVVYLAPVGRFETYIKDLMEKETFPDIIGFPQPGQLLDFAKLGKVIPVNTFLEEEYLQQQYPESYLEMATVDGDILGAWHSTFIKSLVWYPKKAFEAKGYQVPETWDEMMALSNRIVADGGTPWCIGIESGDATGWVGTDWLEDILLRTAPAETYDAWVGGDLPFNSPQVRRAFEIMGQIWLDDDYVYGGREYILTEGFLDGLRYFFDEPPGCYMIRQASYAPNWLQENAVFGQDFDFFYLPPIDPEHGKPVLISGDIYAMFNDRPEVREVMRYLTTPESTKAMIENGGFLAPHKDTPLEWYPSARDLRLAQILLEADTIRFDGSDLMPGVVGSGSFWRGIGDWVQGEDLEAVLQEIDASWPE